MGQVSVGEVQADGVAADLSLEEAELLAKDLPSMTDDQQVSFRRRRRRRRLLLLLLLLLLLPLLPLRVPFPAAPACDVAKWS